MKAKDFPPGGHSHARQGILSFICVHSRLSAANNSLAQSESTRVDSSSCAVLESAWIEAATQGDGSMNDWRKRIAVDPDVMLGKPVIAGTRIPVEQILRKLAAGVSISAILRDHPRLTKADVQAALAYASDAVGSEEILLTGQAQ